MKACELILAFSIREARFYSLGGVLPLFVKILRIIIAVDKFNDFLRFNLLNKLNSLK